MKTRLIENYVTTIAGLLILAYALYEYSKGATMADVSLIAGYAFIFLRSKDSLIGLPKADKVQSETPKAS